MKFGVLGPLLVLADSDQGPHIGGPRARSLLALLLLTPGKVVTTETLIDGVYGERPPGDATNALQAQLSRLRRALGEARLIVARAGGYLLDVEPTDVDAHRFEALTRRGRQALAEGDPGTASALLGEAVALWRGPALADVRDAPFAEAQVARLEESRATAVEDLVRARLSLGESDAVLADLSELIATHPLRERPRALLMRALHACGRRSEALAVFADARRVLAEELGTEPSGELAATHLEVLRAEPAARLTNAPAQLTSFVGRQAELARILELLSAARLVTVTGPGGCGKTRLAVESAAGFGGRTCFVDLAAVSGDAEVFTATLAALGLRRTRLFAEPGAADDPAERLAAALADRELLLLLDNCEHVLDAVARLAHTLLAACPRLRILATSREQLGVTGEHLLVLLPLPVHAESEQLDSPAVRLFAERAAAVRPGFSMAGDAATTQLVAGICVALDGLPLAIELAAARLRSLTPRQLHDRLGDHFRLLSTGGRNPHARHRTLRAVVRWSWDLLPTGERRLLRRLAVFRAGATASAAATVCGQQGEPDVGATEELLSGLVDKSLLDFHDGRYRMLETIRAYAAEMLTGSGEHHQLARAHAEFFLALAEETEPALRAAQQVRVLERLAPEQANFHAALRWAVDADARLALRLVGALGSYWRLRGAHGEVAPLAARLLDRIGLDPPAGTEEEYVLCVLAAEPAAPPRWREHVQRAERIMLTAPWPVRRPELLIGWATHAGPPAPDTPASPIHVGFARSGDPWHRGLRHFSLGYVKLFQGHHADAAPQFALADEAFRSVGDRWGSAQVLDGMATLAELRSDHDTALALTDEAIELVGELDAAEELAELWCRKADRLLRGGYLAEAAGCYEHAVERAKRTGLGSTLALGYRGLAELATAAGEPEHASRLCERALRLCGTGWQDTAARCRVLTTLGRAAESEGKLTAARESHHNALALALAHLPPSDIAEAAEGLAGAAIVAGAAERATLLLGAAAAVRGAAAVSAHAQRVARDCRRALGSAGYGAILNRCAALSREEALAALRAGIHEA
ncbi:putative ATPase/DNA-binding SARP family transcriptional activator [Saccharomonospora amisosensis]|uniref:Putative ATPase/DNA-binding SARP family transcriptional activator n=1 Tax=Saccharomonospora amisosensis TaxID=1128677 RepID=A0A7X5URC1_9PSEU|nr:BTAD domain-containing putative transcriptional regulator [Saccharomonospora amisosensis]NIJ12314.1 putative ATPase/DNA-binding SARP family transcriptional activator [Saccharomonospora amisosensis]